MGKLKLIVQEVALISTAMILGLGISEMLLHFLKGITNFELPWYIPLSIPFTALLCALPTILLDELPFLNTNLVFRRLVHFFTLYGLVSFCGHLFGWFVMKEEYLALTGEFIAIYLVVWAATCFLGKQDEKKINEYLENIRDQE